MGMAILLVLILVGMFILVALYVMVSYNGLVKLRMRVNEGWSGIDIQLKRRYDLIPNLVETVKGFAKHESETLTKVMEARSKATQMTIDPTNVTAEEMAKFSQAQQGLSGVLKNLFAVSESYPELKANENFLRLQSDLTDTEDKIQASRRFYNIVVMEFNTKVEMFPSNLVAKMFNFTKREFFEIINEQERENVKVSF
jgi:LemA protein